MEPIVVAFDVTGLGWDQESGDRMQDTDLHCRVGH